MSEGHLARLGLPAELSQTDGSSASEKAPRLRLRFERGPEAAAIGHLDLARVWERAFQAGGVSVSYSRGNRPQPRLTLAAGLPMGVTSEGELLDVILARRLPPTELAERVRAHLPPGLAVRDVWEVGLGLPSLPSAVRWADYEVDVPVADEGPDVAGAVVSLLAAETFPWQDTRGEKRRHYDLRSLVREIRVLRAGIAANSAGPPQNEDERRPRDVTRLWMRLRCDTAGVGRPDQVVKALGLPEPARVHRRRLVLAEVSPARDAWRRIGRFVE